MIWSSFVCFEDTIIAEKNREIERKEGALAEIDKSLKEKSHTIATLQREIELIQVWWHFFLFLFRVHNSILCSLSLYGNLVLKYSYIVQNKEAVDSAELLEKSHSRSASLEKQVWRGHRVFLDSFYLSVISIYVILFHFVFFYRLRISKASCNHKIKTKRFYWLVLLSLRTELKYKLRNWKM